MRIHHFFLGYEDLEVDPRHADCFLNLCRATGYPYLPLPCSSEGFRVRCTLSVAARLRHSCSVRGIRITTVHRGGVPPYLAAYRRRVGLLIGMALAIAVLQAGSGVLWAVRVRGNSALSDAQVLQQLAESGLHVGMPIGPDGPDTREIENRLLQRSPDIAWVSVNLHGTVADVQLREKQVGEAAQEQGVSNLVAAFDGIVCEVRPLSGKVVVDVGQQVRAGELLISGVRDSAALGFSVEGASGEVMARTQHTEVIQIPLQIEQKVYTGEEKCEKSLIFFKKSIKFSKSTGIMGGSCDTIYSKNDWTLPTGAVLPMGVETVCYRPYTITTVQRTQQQAYALAREQLETLLRQQAAQALLLSRTTRVSYSETHCTLVCDYTCLRDIAVRVPLGWQDGSPEAD